MKALILYRPQSDHGRKVEEFVSNFKADRSSYKLETINIDTREGSSTASLYDVTAYPAILVLRDDGILQHLWEGTELPLVSEVESYFHS